MFISGMGGTGKSFLIKLLLMTRGHLIIASVQLPDLQD